MVDRFKGFWQIFQTASSKRTLGLLALLVIVAAIPLTVIVSQKQQEIRQRACEGDREYNECTGCQTSRRVAYVCGQYSVVVGSQYDAGCTGGCSSTCNPDRQYNECTGCNTSRRISNNECNNTYTVVIQSQPDATCTSGCPSAPPEPDCNDQQCTYIQDVGIAECPSGKKTVVGRQKSGGPCRYLGSCSVTSCILLSTPTPTGTLAPTPTFTPTPTGTPIPTPTTTIITTPTPTTSTPTPNPLAAVLKFSLTLGGLGPNISLQGGGILRGNTDPKTKTRRIQTEVFNMSNQKVADVSGDVVYNSSTQKFEGTIPLNTAVATGNYIVKVKTDKYLKKQIGKGEGRETQFITAGQENNMSATLIAGDITNDNIVDARDYNLYYNCFGDRNSASCGANKKNVDLNDDEIIDSRQNMKDYLLLLYAFSQRNGD